MKRRTVLKLSMLALALTSASAYDMKKIVNKSVMKKKDMLNPSKGELKHTPLIKVGAVDNKGFVSIEVIIGQDGIIHPSTKDHWIYKIELYANGDKIASAEFEAGVSTGYLVTKVKKDGLKELRAVSWCNLHGVWENTVTV